MGMQMTSARHALALGLVLAAGFVQAAIADDDPQIVSGQAFLNAHPDIRWRRAGEAAYGRQRYGEAFGYFRDAARYADKTSQAMVAEMLWKGEGVSQDKPLAYAWMDLAAERGYAGLIAMRERYWAELGEAERKRAVDAGQSVYAEFGDKAAKPRMERELVRARQQVTGSRIGHIGALAMPGSIDQHGASNSPIDVASFGHVTDGSRYYDARYWDPKQYWQWQDRQWRQAVGHVDVGPLQAVDKTK